MAPNQGNFYSSRTIQDISALNQVYPMTQFSTAVDMLSNGTPMMIQRAPSQTSIGTTFIHQALKSLTDYMKRKST